MAKPPRPPRKRGKDIMDTARLQHFKPPNDGCWVGMAMDFTAWDFNFRKYFSKLGFAPGAYNVFVHLPLNEDETQKLDTLLLEIGNFKGIAMVTVEPKEGITDEAMPNSAIVELAKLVAKYEQLNGVRTIIRFAHEMNGNWYTW
jgi:hypothetical protein